MRKEEIFQPLSDREYGMLADIFRVILKEINYREDVDKLAPGEMGINYKTGELWVRNPHNGKVFCANSVEFWKSISKKYDRITGLLNADTVRGIRYYTDLIELEKLDTSYTPDTVIRQMYAPAILYAPVKYDNYEALGWPSKSGMVHVVKLSEEYVLIRYYADLSNLTYEGRYNQQKHLFEGWALSSGNPDDYFAETVGGGTSTAIELKVPKLFDLMSVIVRVSEDIYPGANISVNGNNPKPIIMQNGVPLDTPIVANSTIMLVYDEKKDSWVMLGSTDSVTAAILRIVLERVANALEDVEQSKSEMESTVEKVLAELEARVETKLKELSEKYDRLLTNMSNTIKTRPGNLYPILSYFTAEHDNTSEVGIIDNFNGKVDKLIVNYGQTILREEFDYTIQDNGIRFTDRIRLAIGDVLQFIVLKQQDPADEI